MTVSLKHAFTSAIADSGDTTLVQPSNWNAEHNLTMAANALLGRTTAGTGSVEEISVSTGLSFSAGVLSVGATTPQTNTTNTFTASQIISVTDNTNAALRITQLGTGESIRVEDSANPDATPFVVTATGAVGVGTASPSTILHAQVLGGTSNGLQLTTEGNTLLNMLAYTDTASNWTRYYRYRGTQAAPTIVASGDLLHYTTYNGYDGSADRTAAAMAVKVDGTPGASDMPGRIEFYTTPDGSASLVERMRIRNDGGVAIGGAGLVNVGLNLAKSLTGSTTVTALYANGTIQPDATGSDNYFATTSATAANGATPYTITAINHYNAIQGTFNADSTVANQVGFNSSATLIGATNNYAFFSANTAAVTTGKTAYGFYSAANTATGGGTTYGFFAGGTANNVMPNLSGGIAASSTLTLQSTTGAGTTDAIIFKTASQTERFRIDTSGALGIGGANYGTSGQVLTSGGSGAAPSWASLSGAAVTSLSFGTTGLTPSTATQGAITVAGTLAAANGGTGQSSYAVGDILYASTTTALSKLADVATGNALISGGVGVAPSWGKIGLTTHVNGTLAVANGGTGATTANAALTNLTTYATTATAAGTTVLTNTSEYFQFFTGTSTQTITLPVTSTLATGWTFHIVNNSTGNLTVNSSGGNLVITVLPGTTAMCTCIGTSLTTAADWEAGLTDFSTATGTGSVVLSSNPVFGTGIRIGTGGTLAAGSIASNSNWGMWIQAPQSSPAQGDFVFLNSAGTIRMAINPSGAFGVGSSPSYGTSGQALISSGTGAAPTWGTLGVAGGGTGVTSATAYALIAGGTTSTGALQSLGTGTAGQVLSSGGSSALPSWVPAGAVYLGQGVGNTVSFTSLGTYSKFIAFVAIGTNSSSNRNATAAVSSDNGASYSAAKQITPSVVSTGASFAYGTVEISGVGVVGNKTYTPASVSTNQNSYSTVSTETTVTGVTNALQFDRTGTGTTITVILFGVP